MLVLKELIEHVRVTILLPVSEPHDVRHRHPRPHRHLPADNDPFANSYLWQQTVEPTIIHHLHTDNLPPILDDAVGTETQRPNVLKYVMQYAPLFWDYRVIAVLQSHRALHVDSFFPLTIRITTNVSSESHDIDLGAFATWTSTTSVQRAVRASDVHAFPLRELTELTFQNPHSTMPRPSLASPLSNHMHSPRLAAAILASSHLLDRHARAWLICFLLQTYALLHHLRGHMIQARRAPKHERRFAIDVLRNFVNVGCSPVRDGTAATGSPKEQQEKEFHDLVWYPFVTYVLDRVTRLVAKSIDDEYELRSRNHNDRCRQAPPPSLVTAAQLHGDLHCRPDIPAAFVRAVLTLLRPHIDHMLCRRPFYDSPPVRPQMCEVVLDMWVVLHGMLGRSLLHSGLERQFWPRLEDPNQIRSMIFTAVASDFRRMPLPNASYTTTHRELDMLVEGSSNGQEFSRHHGWKTRVRTEPRCGERYKQRSVNEEEGCDGLRGSVGSREGEARYKRRRAESSPSEERDVERQEQWHGAAEAEVPPVRHSVERLVTETGYRESGDERPPKEEIGVKRSAQRRIAIDGEGTSENANLDRVRSSGSREGEAAHKRHRMEATPSPTGERDVERAEERNCSVEVEAPSVRCCVEPPVKETGCRETSDGQSSQEETESERLDQPYIAIDGENVNEKENHDRSSSVEFRGEAGYKRKRVEPTPSEEGDFKRQDQLQGVVEEEITLVRHSVECLATETRYSENSDQQPPQEDVGMVAKDQHRIAIGGECANEIENCDRVKSSAECREGEASYKRKRMEATPSPTEERDVDHLDESGYLVEVQIPSAGHYVEPPVTQTGYNDTFDGQCPQEDVGVERPDQSHSAIDGEREQVDGVQCNGMLTAILGDSCETVVLSPERGDSEVEEVASQLVNRKDREVEVTVHEQASINSEIGAELEEERTRKESNVTMVPPTVANGTKVEGQVLELAQELTERERAVQCRELALRRRELVVKQKELEWKVAELEKVEAWKEEDVRRITQQLQEKNEACEDARQMKAMVWDELSEVREELRNVAKNIIEGKREDHVS